MPAAAGTGLFHAHARHAQAYHATGKVGIRHAAINNMPGTESSFAEGSTDALFVMVYARLKAMAARQLRSRHGATLDTTELVHELYMRMGQNDTLRFEHPAQFFSYAARAMRHLLTNRARDRLRLRAGGQWMKVTLNQDDLKLALDTADQALALDAALDALEKTDARAAQVVELHYFAGLSLQQIGDALGLARRTIDRDWRFARAFLKAHMD